MSIKPKKIDEETLTKLWAPILIGIKQDITELGILLAHYQYRYSELQEIVLTWKSIEDLLSHKQSQEYEESLQMLSDVEKKIDWIQHAIQMSCNQTNN